MPQPVSLRLLSVFRLGLAALLLTAACVLVLLTYRWPLYWDAQVFHYGNFLIAHGFVPYREIIDMNLPGAYLFDGWATKLFGGGDLGWRLYDFALLGSLCVGMSVIARPYDWLAGCFAGLLFALVHSSEGPQNSGQREEVITVLLVLACAFLCEAYRRRWPWLTFFFGLSAGLAASIKPTDLPLGILLFALAVWECGRRKESVARYAAGTLLGLAVAVGFVAHFLAHPGSTSALVTITRQLTPVYAGMERVNFHLMTRFSLPIAAWVLLPFALAIRFASRLPPDWEEVAILVCAAFGAFSYFLQGKAYGHHRYVFTAFLLLWIAIQFVQAVHRRGWVRVAGFAGLCLGTLVLVPQYLRDVRHAALPNLFTPQLEQDLTAMGAQHLQHQVQCLDLVDGCYIALYQLKIVQSTGWMGDVLLFTRSNNAGVRAHRESFWRMIQAHPPTVFVLSNEDFNQGPSFAKLDAWPLFAEYLRDHYRIAVTRVFPQEQDHGYRIYVRDGVTLPTP